MKAGVLVLGSLLWDRRDGRHRWRDERLNRDQAVPVAVPIGYGRLSHSWGNTFTMTFSSDGRAGVSFLVPLKTPPTTFSALLAEAEFLWKVESRGASPKRIGASWGCVGILSRTRKFVAEWADYFRKSTDPVGRVDESGLLLINWPRTRDGAAADVDVIVSASTKPESVWPLAADIADAWVRQDDTYERYFFQNVQHGIRTPDDGAIWTRIQEKNPLWLDNEVYSDAIAILRAEQEGSD